MITNFGSYCIDNVYQVPYFVKPGETLPCNDYKVHAGGKGLNQSLAMAYAGAKVRHAGRVGHDGIWMKQLLDDAGVDTSLTVVTDEPSGHANIQVSPDGENAIVLFGGANRSITPSHIEPVMKTTSPGDFILLQNEISALTEVMTAAAAYRQRIVFNAAPFTESVNDYPLDLVEVFIINEVEGSAISGQQSPDAILDAMFHLFPDARIVLTLGRDGVLYRDKLNRVHQPALPVLPVDTTGAGDTFTGYFLAAYSREESIRRCLEFGCAAAAVCVTRSGAATSIPTNDEI